MGRQEHEIGLLKENGVLLLFANTNGKRTTRSAGNRRTVYFRSVLDLNARHNVLEYSFDNQRFSPLGEACELAEQNYFFWKGTRPGLFSYNTKASAGVALFDWFHYRYDGPLGGQN